MIDFGIVALLIIQLAACVGALVAWIGMRHEADRINARQSYNDQAITGLADKFDVVKAAVNGFDERLSALEAMTGRACRAAEDAKEQAANHKGEIRSIKATIAANRRWNREEEDGAATDTPLPETPLQPAQEARNPQKNDTFGKRILAS